MRPTFEMLVFQLSKIWNIRSRPAKHSLGQLSLPLLYEYPMDIKNNHAYISTVDNLPPEWLETEECCIICCNGSPPEYYNNSGCGLIVIDPSIPLIAVHNRVQFIFSLYQDWEDRLLKIVEKNGTLQELLDVSSLVVENLLCLTDQNINLLAVSSRGKRINHDSLLLSLFTQEANFQALKAASKKITTYCHKLDLKHVKNLDESYELFFIDIFDGKINIGALSIHPTEHVLQDHDHQLLEILSSYVQTLLLRPSQVEGRSFINLLESLLSGLPVKEGEIARLEAVLDFGHKDSYRCIAIQPPLDVVTKNGNYLRRRFQLEVPAAIALIHEGFLIGVINETKAGWDSKIFYQLVTTWLGKMDFVAGASDSFCNLTELKEYYQEARAAIMFANPNDSRVRTFADCWDSYVLANCTGGLPAKLLFLPGFQRVIEYNKTSSVDYVETLRVWLEEGRNDSRAAARLFISRNSFLCRRERLISLLGDNLDDPEERFRLSLCLRLYYTDNRPVAPQLRKSLNSKKYPTP
jgi:hypothetical protein